jgi:hypothetical protein
MGMGKTFRRGGTFFLLSAALFLWTSPGRAQNAPASPPADPALADSVRTLQQQVKDLQSAVADMRREVDESHAEARSLRADLESVRETASGLKTEVATGGSGGTSPAVPISQSAAPNPTLEQRLDQIEGDQQLLNAKVNDQEQSKVESGSKYHVRLSGIVLTNVFSNSAAVDNQDFPSLAVPSPAPGSNGSVGATLRQSELGLDVTGPTLAGARTAASIQFDFAGGFPNTENGVTNGLVRLRTATMRLDWQDTSVIGGQDSLFFVPLQPTSLASLAVPALAYAGNLWTWTPQVVLEHRLKFADGSSLGLEAGVLDPLTGEYPYDTYYRYPSAGESSRQPAYAGHISWSHPALGRSINLGVGGYYSRENWGLDRNVDAWAGTADALIPLPGRLEFSGEFYRGRAVGGIGGGVGQTIVQSGPTQEEYTIIQGLNSAGGWAQLKFRATERLEFNGSYGLDSPFANQLREFPGWGDYNNASVARNRQYLVNSIFRPRSDLLFSLEYRRLYTVYIPEDRYSANIVSLSMGVLF